VIHHKVSLLDVGVRLKGEGSLNSFLFLVALPLHNNNSSANYTRWEGDIRVAPSAQMQVALPLRDPSQSFTIRWGVRLIGEGSLNSFFLF